MTQDLRIALEHLQAGRLVEAERIYGQVLRVEPNNPDALHFLGLIDQQLGKNASAVELIEKAHRFGRPHPISLNNLGKAYLGLFRPREARKCFNKALALKPDYAEAHNNLGVSLRGLGRLKEAERSYRRALSLQPDYGYAYYNLGNALRDLGRPGDAEKSYRQASALQPDNAEIYNNLGNLLLDLDRIEEAATSYGQALALKPEHVEAHHNLGNALKDLGRLDEAEQSYRKALALRPDLVETLINLGNTLQHLDRLEEAVQCYRRVLALKPDLAEAHYNLGNALRDLVRLEEAGQSYRQALALRPDFTEARWAFAMSQLPAMYEADCVYEDYRNAFSRELGKLRDWYDLNQPGDGFKAVGILHPFYLAYQEENNRDLLSEYGKLCTRLMQDWWDKERFPPIHQATGDTVRVGIVSAHIRDHSVWNAIVKGWIQHLDRKRIDVYVFHTGFRQDQETFFAKSRASHFEQGKKNIRRWVEAILAQHLDAIIYPEVGMDPLTVKLAALRLAPVQLSAWGHPETTGLPTIDYYLSAEMFEPTDAQHNYTERLLALPNLGCSYRPLSAASVEPDLAALGIDRDGPLLVCPGFPFKYAPRHDWVFTEIARRLERCRFVFFALEPRNLSEKLSQRLREAFARAQLDFDRYAVFIPKQARPVFHGLMKRADVFLDTIGFSGFNTAMQAVECGLPIVAKEGRFMRGRFASGILKRMGLQELVSASDEDYVEVAIRLAKDPEYRQYIRTRIETSRHLLYDDPAPIRSLEDFLIGAVRHS